MVTPKHIMPDLLLENGYEQNIACKRVESFCKESSKRTIN
jgi:hypothetical protein